MPTAGHHPVRQTLGSGELDVVLAQVKIIVLRIPRIQPEPAAARSRTAAGCPGTEPTRCRCAAPQGQGGDEGRCQLFLLVLAQETHLWAQKRDGHRDDVVQVDHAPVIEPLRGPIGTSVCSPRMREVIGATISALRCG